MSILFVFLVLASEWIRCDTEDICQVCDCLPFGDKPLQAFCVDKGYKVFWPSSLPQASSLQLVYISGMKSVIFDQKSFQTEGPLDLLLQDCSYVQILDDSINHLRSLVIQDVKVANVGVLDSSELWSVLLENIDVLTLDNTNFKANYSVKIEDIGSLTISATQEENLVCENSELRFTLFGSVIKPVSTGGLMICGNQIKLEGNTFKSVSEEGFQITAESHIKITDNHFQNISKQVFDLTSPEIYISGNHFETLPAGALSEVSTLQDTFFTNNTIQDIDLGGVLLDMSWGMTIEKNMIDCDCASKRTSILNPKEGMLYLTNSSHEILQNIFLNNYCRLNCTVSLKTFSYALIQGDVCLTNNTRLEEEKLCDVTILPESNSDNIGPSLVSAASRTEFLIPLSIIVVTVLLTSSICYGLREMKTFKYVFNPHRSSTPKLPTE